MRTLDLLIVEDDPSWSRRHLGVVSRQQLEVATAATLQEADVILSARVVRFAVVDRRMPDDNGATWLHGRMQRYPWLDGVVCTCSTPDEVASEKAALRLDYVHKDSARPGELVRRLMYRGLARRVSEASDALAMAAADLALLRGFTVRQLDVLTRRAAGMSTEATALDLGLSLATVDSHWRVCRRADRIRTEAEMARFLLGGEFRLEAPRATP